MMPYKIFVSHAESDKHLAEAFVEWVGAAFAPDIEFYLAIQRLVGGDIWQDELRQHLAENDAIISIVTQGSIEKPWLYIEWGPFWVNKKMWHVLCTDEIEESDILPPMNSRQVTRIQNGTSIFKLVGRMAQDAGLGARMVPEGWIASFSAAVEIAIQRDTAESYERYANASEALPPDAASVRKILEYFFKKGTIAELRSIYRRIDDNAIKADIALMIAKSGDLGLAAELCDENLAADHIGRVASGIIRAGHADAPELRRILVHIRDLNNAELRKVAEEVLDRGGAESDVFRFMAMIMDNMAELRKLGIRMLERRLHPLPIFADVTARLGERSYYQGLRDIGLRFVHEGLYGSDEFVRILLILMTQKGSYALPVLNDLKQRVPEVLPVIP